MTMTAPKPKFRWFQFSLRTLLLLMLVASIGLSWFAMKLQHVRRQREVVVAIEKAGGEVEWYTTSTPQWLIHLLGERFFCTHITVSFYGNQITDKALEHLKGLTLLRCLGLQRTQVTANGLEHLKGLSRLQNLTLKDTQVTDAGLEHLKGMNQLQYLNLDWTQVTDAGLEHLKGLSQLRVLYLQGTQVTDTGLEHLKGLSQLEWLLVAEGHRCTDDGVKKLEHALPNCNIGR